VGVECFVDQLTPLTHANNNVGVELHAWMTVPGTWDTRKIQVSQVKINFAWYQQWRCTSGRHRYSSGSRILGPEFYSCLQTSITIVGVAFCIQRKKDEIAKVGFGRGLQSLRRDGSFP
jgi:hypothetical protein